jgi:hypothetical protein
MGITCRVVDNKWSSEIVLPQIRFLLLFGEAAVSSLISGASSIEAPLFRRFRFFLIGDSPNLERITSLSALLQGPPT